MSLVPFGINMLKRQARAQKKHYAEMLCINTMVRVLMLLLRIDISSTVGPAGQTEC